MIGDLTDSADETAARRLKWPAAISVLGVAITWGVSFAVVKALVGDVSPSRLVGWRFAVATFTLIAVRPKVLHELDRRTVRRGAVLGSLLGSGFVLCTAGMQTTSILISAFVVGTTVLFTPLIAWIWLRRRLTARDASAACLALVGLAMITLRSLAVGSGTLLILAAAGVWAVHLVALTRWSRAGRLYGLTVVQLATSAVVAMGCQIVVDDGQGLWPPISVSAAAGIIFLGAAATGGAFIVLSWAQTRLNATTTAVILTMEPLAGAGLGVALGDTWTAATAVGAIAVLTAVILAARPGSRTTRPWPRGLIRYLRRSERGRQWLLRSPQAICRPSKLAEIQRP
jgi:drug/metabolite transporter (DMT)-like permease